MSTDRTVANEAGNSPRCGDFASRLLDWWQSHGRRDLPWQNPRTPYRVWISEIMLQQTRAETVVPYFLRFVSRFRQLGELASAPLDEVLALWSGLGYYARARNLHAAARLCMECHQGRLPDDPQVLESLPGIGRSTAAAIAAQGFGRPAAILDGNVKRVMARHAGIEGWPGRAPVARRLWAASEARTPGHSAAEYTQAIMDLGASVCGTRSPACRDCPVRADCQARIHGRTAELPAPRPRRSLGQRGQSYLLVRDRGGRVLLRRRPPTGIWGGLWCLPESGDPAVRPIPAARVLETRLHQFTHFRLEMKFCRGQLRTGTASRDDPDLGWFDHPELSGLGLPQPIRETLVRLMG